MEWSRQIRAAATAAVVTDDKGIPLKDDKGDDIKLLTGIALYTDRHCYITQTITDGDDNGTLQS